MKATRRMIRELVREQAQGDLSSLESGSASDDPPVIDVEVIKKDSTTQTLKVSVLIHEDEAPRVYMIKGPLENIIISPGPGTFGEIRGGSFPIDMVKGYFSLGDLFSAGYSIVSDSDTAVAIPEEIPYKDVGDLKDANVVEVSNIIDWQKHVKSSSGYVMVDIWADWCAPCKTIAPELVLASTKTGIKLVKIDVSKKGAWRPPVSKDLYSGSLPTVILFKDGKPIGSAVGADQIRTKIKQAERMMKESSASNISVTAKRLREIIRDEILREIVRKRDCTDSKGKKGKWVLLTKKKPHKKLGCHQSEEDAMNQERAIKASRG